MSAPARMRVYGAAEVMIPRYHGMYKARKSISNDLNIDDRVLVDCSIPVKVINKYKCSACVELSDGERTVVSYDRLSKL